MEQGHLVVDQKGPASIPFLSRGERIVDYVGQYRRCVLTHRGHETLVLRVLTPLRPISLRERLAAEHARPEDNPRERNCDVFHAMDVFHENPQLSCLTSDEYFPSGSESLPLHRSVFRPVET
jgi:hypothetical protein